MKFGQDRKNYITNIPEQLHGNITNIFLLMDKNIIFLGRLSEPDLKKSVTINDYDSLKNL